MSANFDDLYAEIETEARAGPDAERDLAEKVEKYRQASADLFLPEMDTMLLPGHAQSTNGSDAGAIFNSSPTEKATHRYALWRLWDPLRKPLVVIGLNPSTATAFVSDPTVTRCTNYAKDWGYGGLTMLNLFSLRSTDPQALYKATSFMATGGGDHNEYLIYFTRSERAGKVLAAWGNHGAFLERGARVAEMLESVGVEFECLGITKSGQPKHPLYLRRDAKPIEWKASSIL